MKNTPLARVLVRWRKVTSLLPLAAIVGIVVMVRAGGVYGSANAYVPFWARGAVTAATPYAGLGWVLLTMFCSAREATRATKARKITDLWRVLRTLVVGVVIFFCYVFASAAIVMLLAASLGLL